MRCFPQPSEPRQDNRDNIRAPSNHFHFRNMADDDLLARLNALKAPTNAPKASASTAGPHPSIRHSNQDDDITARFRRLASGEASSGSRQTPSRANASSQSKLEDVVARLPSERVENVEDEQSLDELLKELGEDQSSWMNNVSEEDRVSTLLKEAKAALPQRSAGDLDGREEQEDGEGREVRPKYLDTEHLKSESDERVLKQDEQDEKDADDYIAQIMADIELRKKEGTYKDDDSGSQGVYEEKDLPDRTSVEPQARAAREATPLDDLPSAPSTAPVLASISDDDLEARFASLSLPTTPSTKPGAKKHNSASAKAKSNLPTYTDEDIESWCVICNEDATVRCLGCEGDLYCQECWAEGHTGPDAGYDEKRHKAVLYTKDRGQEKRKRLAAAA